MKVNFKRVATAALAVAMSLSLNVPAFAAGNDGDKKLIVSGDTLDNKKVYAVQMFTAHATGTDSVVFDNYELADENWLDFFHAATGDGGLNKPEADADAARAYLEKLASESTEVKAFADKAQAWVRNHSADFVVITSDTEDPAVADKETFSNLKPGYYLVYPEGGSTGNNRDTDAMLVNVPRDKNAELNIKSTFPTVDKKVDTNETVGDIHDDATANGSAQVGDTVTFILTSAVPDMSDYEDFYFAFNDKLTKGLAFVDNSVEVTIGTVQNETLTGHYTVTKPTGESNLLKVEIEHLEDIVGIKVGDPIVVTYKAMITEDATTVNPATNEVEVEYSNDPNDTTHGTSTPDISKVYTYDIDVNKWALSGKQDNPATEEVDESKIKNLAGAEFILSTNQTAPTEEQIKGEYANYNGLVKLFKLDDNSYRVAKPDDTPKENSFLTTNSDDINIAGLEAGTYYLHEVKAPDGYNKLKDPVEIVIEITNMDTGAATIKVNGDDATGIEGNVIDVENKKGIELPETGSIGTIGLTVAGVAIVLIGVFAPRKKNNQE